MVARTWQLAVRFEYMTLYTIFGGKIIYNNNFENRLRFDENNRMSRWSMGGTRYINKTYIVLSHLYKQRCSIYR